MNIWKHLNNTIKIDVILEEQLFKTHNLGFAESDFGILLIPKAGFHVVLPHVLVPSVCDLPVDQFGFSDTTRAKGLIVWFKAGWELKTVEDSVCFEIAPCLVMTETEYSWFLICVHPLISLIIYLSLSFLPCSSVYQSNSFLYWH